MRRPSVYAKVWRVVYRLTPGDIVTVPELTETLPIHTPSIWRMQIWRATQQAVEARLLRVKKRSGQRTGVVFERERLPRVITVERAVLGGGRFMVAWNVYDSLRVAGLLRLEDGGFVAVEEG